MALLEGAGQWEAEGAVTWKLRVDLNFPPSPAIATLHVSRVTTSVVLTVVILLSL